MVRVYEIWYENKWKMFIHMEGKKGKVRAKTNINIWEKSCVCAVKDKAESITCVLYKLIGIASRFFGGESTYI